MTSANLFTTNLFNAYTNLSVFNEWQEHYGYVHGLNMAWVGDGNNITHSLMMAAPKMGINLNIATPKVWFILYNSSRSICIGKLRFKN